MPYYQHYSFDLWLTLIKSNPDFKIERARYFHQHHNALHKSVEEIAGTFRRVDLMVNAINEKTGKNIDADEMYLMVIDSIHDGQLNLDKVDTLHLHAMMEELLFRYPPLLYSDVTFDTLILLKQNSGGTFSLLSNTGYITGKTLRKVLELYKLNDFFDFQLYSDEAGMSKPNKGFFNVMLNNIDIANPGKSIPLADIIHVGDNPKNDIAPTVEVGINSLLINSNKDTILNLVT
ncbi:HAD family hydrolase [Mucilaginibacter psychrotolerans]|uniref:HAD family hydrolase n=1 Tax=Mucilaginibacter psychrotolerans TaxID=1524096 RepID=A0A4Y8SCM0_9SPHI|nr:HAD family hydrolase [Mucilaginibacter psychrotolerans]TFF36337.1 HAD family hydrolase [Mucilaginibacter psychrotolerans]